MSRAAPTKHQTALLTDEPQLQFGLRFARPLAVGRSWPDRLFQRMKAYQVALGIDDQGDKAILTYREFVLKNLSAIAQGAGCLAGTVFTAKIYKCAANT